jgi:hypothetical protein
MRCGVSREGGEGGEGAGRAFASVLRQLRGLRAKSWSENGASHSVSQQSRIRFPLSPGGEGRGEGEPNWRTDFISIVCDAARGMASGPQMAESWRTYEAAAPESEDVAQISNLLYRRIPFCERPKANRPPGFCGPPVGNRRYHHGAPALVNAGCPHPRCPLWSAPAKRSGDGALRSELLIVLQGGVALRLPPHSMMLRADCRPSHRRLANSRAGLANRNRSLYGPHP